MNNPFGDLVREKSLATSPKGFFMFIIPLSNALCETKHYEKMGVALWLYIWLLDKVTKIDSDGNGLVLGGKPIKIEEVPHINYENAKRYFKILEEYKYIITKRTGYGKIIKLTKCKKIFGEYKKPDSTKMPYQIGQKCPITYTKNALSNKTVNKTIKKTLPDKSGLQEKKVNDMKTYDENKSFEEEAIDLESGELVIKEKKKKERKQNVVMEIISWAEEQRKVKFTNYGKQMKYVAMMLHDGEKTQDEIADRWEEMAKDKFWIKTGYDFKNVADSFDKK